ncbi:dihydropteroate synthase [Aquamicrobium segne]|uniref:Dihydropteroate synthase n=1 Tax=Aquamicrobium segne TaxID=469547 RepID=A0ABW0GUZ7_9HYPH
MAKWHLAHGRQIELGKSSVVMGILNVTPNSFSDGGRYAAPDKALIQARTMVAQGAAIIDVGGESTGPKAAPVTALEEQRRIVPVIEALSALDSVLVSVDTYREETARLAVKAGAHIVNDVWGLQKEPGIAAVAAEAGAGLVIMHTGRDRKKHADALKDQFLFLRHSLDIARKAGIDDRQIVLDPGFGFAKETPADNIELMVRFEELHALGFPLLAGTSRKRFIGAITGREDALQRDAGTAATSAILRLKGAALFRVHNVAINVDALAVADAIVAHRSGLAAHLED